jgi:hypothetical protein
MQSSLRSGISNNWATKFAQLKYMVNPRFHGAEGLSEDIKRQPSQLVVEVALCHTTQVPLFTQ